MPGLAAYFLDRTTLLGLVEDLGDLLLAEPRLLHRQIPSVAEWPHLPDFSRSDGAVFRAPITQHGDGNVIPETPHSVQHVAAPLIAIRPPNSVALEPVIAV
jgi:hypothetical protein